MVSRGCAGWRGVDRGWGCEGLREPGTGGTLKEQGARGEAGFAVCCEFVMRLMDDPGCERAFFGVFRDARSVVAYRPVRIARVRPSFGAFVVLFEFPLLRLDIRSEQRGEIEVHEDEEQDDSDGDNEDWECKCFGKGRAI